MKLCLLAYKTLMNQQPTYLYNSLSFPSLQIGVIIQLIIFKRQQKIQYGWLFRWFFKQTLWNSWETINILKKTTCRKYILKNLFLFNILRTWDLLVWSIKSCNLRYLHRLFWFFFLKSFQSSMIDSLAGKFVPIRNNNFSPFNISPLFAFR